MTDVLRGCLKTPERGCVVLDQPQQASNFQGFKFITPRCGWSATQPRSFFRQALSSKNLMSTMAELPHRESLCAAGIQPLVTPSHEIGRREPQPARFHLGYRPGLDGVRGVAILLVVLVHLGVLPAQCGFIGVDLFFVLADVDILRLAATHGLRQSSRKFNQGRVMSLELELQKYPKDVKLKDNSKVKLRPLKRADETDFHALFLTIPEAERMFIKHRVMDLAVIHDWCANIDLGRNLPLLAVDNGKILGVATLHQQLGGWKRHIGRVSVLVQPAVRGRGIARALVQEIVDIARATGLEKVEAEFIGGQATAIHMFAMLGFSELLRLEDYVKDMTANSHDYVLMGLELTTDEEYASASG